jgi:hypothetical protein
MMTQSQRREAALMASVYPTLLVLSSLAFDYARDLSVDTAWYLYVLGWLVLFINGFFRERRKVIKN